MLRTPFFTKCRPIFWKYAPRPRWEAWFWKRHKCRFMKNMLLGPPNSARMPPFCTIYCSLKFAKSIGKMCIFCLWPLLGSYIYHRLLYHKASRWDFRIFASFLIFWENARRPRWEAWFWKRHESKIVKNVPLRPYKWPDMHPFCIIFCNLKFAKSIGKMCISRLWVLFGSYI